MVHLNELIFLLLLFVIVILLKLSVYNFKIEQISTVWFRLWLYMIWLKSLVSLTTATYILTQLHCIKASECITAVHDHWPFFPTSEGHVGEQLPHWGNSPWKPYYWYWNHKTPLLCENVLFTDWYNGKMTVTTVVFLALNTWNCSLVTNNPLMYSLAGKNWIHTRGR